MTGAAIVSDIHGNAIALRAAVAELDAERIERVWPAVKKAIQQATMLLRQRRGLPEVA